MYKPQHYGIRGTPPYKGLKTISKKGGCMFNAMVSYLMYVTVTVPQGSILGPLLFTIYVIDLHKSVNHSQCIPFADDTTIIFRHKNIKYHSPSHARRSLPNGWMV